MKSMRLSRKKDIIDSRVNAFYWFFDNMDYSGEQFSVAQKFPGVAGEVEARDVTLRNELRSLGRKLKAPWIMEGRAELKEEEMEVWRSLNRGKLSEEEAASKFTSLMEEYYDLEYPLE